MNWDPSKRSAAPARAAGLTIRKDRPKAPSDLARRGAALVSEPWNRRRRPAGSTPSQRGAHLLKPHEEWDLALRIKAGDSAARDDLVLANLRLVHHIVRDYPKSAVPHEDLVQEGNIGLIRAAQNFDPESHPVRFATYATFWIRAYIQRSLGEGCSLIRFPEYARLLRARYLKLARELRRGQRANPTSELTPELDTEDLARRLGVPKKRLERARLTLIERVAQGEFVEALADRGPAVEAQYIEHESRKAMHAAIESLNPFEAWIIRNRYGLDQPDQDPTQAERDRDDEPLRAGPAGQPRSYHRLGLDCGLPGHRVRTLEKAALEKLRLILARDENATSRRQTQIPRTRRLRADAAAGSDVA